MQHLRRHGLLYSAVYSVKMTLSLLQELLIHILLVILINSVTVIEQVASYILSRKLMQWSFL